MPIHRCVRALVCLLLMCALSRAAHAQTITLPSAGVTHSVARDGNRLNTTINYADCIAKDAIEFPLTLTERGSYSLEAWAGSSCDELSYRTSTSSTACWKVYSAAPTTNTPIVSIPVRSLLYGRTLASGSTTTTTVTDDETASDAGTTIATATSSVPNACNDKSGSLAAQTLTVFFMLVDSGEVAQGNIVKWEATYKLVGPAPPDKVSAGVGEDLLVVSFSYDDASSDTTINGYQFFCDPPPGDAAASNAVVQMDDGGVISPSCTTSTSLIAGTRVDDAIQKFRCGSAATSATQGNAEGLINGVSYNVAVAATDTYQNVGKLSATTCQVPQPVTGFYEAYRNAGGAAGGGFCSFSRQREASVLAFSVLFGLCWLLRRNTSQRASNVCASCAREAPSDRGQK